MNALSLPKDKIKILLLEGIHQSAVELLHAAGYDNVVRLTKALDGEALREALQGPDVTVTVMEPGLFEVMGLTAAQVGEAAAAHGIVLHELSPHQASLEEAFMDLTRGELEFAAT